MTLTSCLFRGEVMHQRLQPKSHRFRYGVTSWLIDLDEIPALQKRLRLFSHNRFNLLSLFDRDLGGREDGTGAASPKQWMLDLLRRQGVDLSGGRILVHGFPRIAGIGFSPLTTWFCYQANGHLAAVHYEVHNTFGERHGYLALLPDGGNRATLTHRADKLFHVSPFLDISGVYRFALKPPGDLFSLVIRQTSDQGDGVLIASHVARRFALTDAAILAILPRLLALPFVVIGGIHWQALKLFLRRFRFHRKPLPPAMISLVHPTGDLSR